MIDNFSIQINVQGILFKSCFKLPCHSEQSKESQLNFLRPFTCYCKLRMALSKIFFGIGVNYTTYQIFSFPCKLHLSV
jgi:hypothetical protein